jgi:AcrR family transcriptional regulator
MKTRADLNLGRREENKRDKLERIRKAATKIFLLKGYDGATLREISAAANVAFGTLFLYAKDKQDLLLLVFDEELPTLSAKAFLDASSEDGLVDQLIAFFACFYQFFLRTPQLSRELMRETTFVQGIVAKRVHLGFENTERHIGMLVARAQAAGEVDVDISHEVVAHLVFSLFRIEIRFCLSEEVAVPARSMKLLRGQIELLMSGLSPRKERTSARKRR